MKKILIGLSLMSLTFLSCQSYFDYKPMAIVEGRSFQITSFTVKDRNTLKSRELSLGSKSEMILSNCDSMKDSPCKGKIILNEKTFNFGFDNSYTAKGIYMNNVGLGFSEKIPDDLAEIILTGDYNVEKRRKGIYVLKGSLGFKKDFPNIYGTHEALIELKLK